ncbi:MAG: hypothetical protein SGBAC_013033 [Bacillariaceae sp.]
MKEAEEKEASKDADDSEHEESALAILLARMEKTESTVESLQERLFEAEKKLLSNQTNSIPWRRIKSRPRSRDSLESGNLTEEDLKDEEEYKLPKDIYTVMSAWKFSSRPFQIALSVVAVQILLLSLLLVDQIAVSDSSLRIFPANVPIIVHISQGLAIIIAVMGQDDLRIAIEGYFDEFPRSEVRIRA